MQKKLTGLASQLVHYLRTNHEWFSKGTLTADMTWRHNKGKSIGKRYLPETVGRALRLLEEQSIIAVKQDGISVQYKWLPHERRAQYIPSSSRTVGNEDKLFRDSTTTRVVPHYVQ